MTFLFCLFFKQRIKLITGDESTADRTHSPEKSGTGAGHSSSAHERVHERRSGSCAEAGVFGSGGCDASNSSASVSPVPPSQSRRRSPDPRQRWHRQTSADDASSSASTAAAATAALSQAQSSSSVAEPERLAHQHKHKHQHQHQHQQQQQQQHLQTQVSEASTSAGGGGRANRSPPAGHPPALNRERSHPVHRGILCNAHAHLHNQRRDRLMDTGHWTLDRSTLFLCP